MHWHYLPESIRAQALARYGVRQGSLDLGPDVQPVSPGPGDGYLYHWISEKPSAGYRGPLPVGRLMRRTKEA